MSILIAHPGTQHLYQVVRGMLRAGQDIEFHTTMMFGEDSPWQNILPGSLFQKRKLNEVPDRIIQRQLLLEFVPGVAKVLGMANTRGYALRNAWFQKGIPSRAISRSSAVIGFDTSSLILAERAKKLGVPFFLELTTPHSKEKQKWLDHIRDNFPEWPIDALDKSTTLIQQEEKEVELATVISAPSTYVRRSHEQYTGARNNFVINPFGADLTSFHPKTAYNKRPRFIFLGALNAAKGLPVLLKAWERAAPDAELVIAGYGQIPSTVIIPKNVTIAGSIKKEDRLPFFHAGDVLVCPSLYEGLAVVQLEAAACGLVVLGTHNSGGSEFLEHEREGLFLPPADVDALAATITDLCKDPVRREEMGRRAAAKAQLYTWQAYIDRWLTVINTHKSKQRG